MAFASAILSESDKAGRGWPPLISAIDVRSICTNQLPSVLSIFPQLRTPRRELLHRVDIHCYLYARVTVDFLKGKGNRSQFLLCRSRVV